MKILVVVVICNCLFGCGRIDTTIYQNCNFEDIRNIGRKNNIPFCIVLTDSSQNLSNEYCLQLQDNYKFLTHKAVYNVVDINLPINEWYLKWLCPVSTPLTCVFSPNGKLIDLIPGAARETFLYTEEAVKKMEVTDFHWSNQFKISKKKVIPLLNNLLEYQDMLNQGIYLSSELTLLVDSLYYPYSIYLKLTGELMMHDTISSITTAQSLIMFETPYSLRLYKDEFITAKKVINPDFDIINEPNIRIDRKIISISNCIINKTISIEIPVYNDGNKPLTISKIYTSCSCIEKAKNVDRIIINANSSVVIPFHFTPDMEGRISRDIFITSNAINLPILYINVLADVISDYKNN